MDPVIEVSLRKKEQVALARLQDSAVAALFETAPDIVMHGGTAIWRCYSGNRFSYDIDIYADEPQMKKILWYLTWALSKRGIKMDYPPLSGRTIFAHDNFSTVKMEAMVPPPKLKGTQREFELVNGTKSIINTLSIDKFIEEKIMTYEKRMFARDLYDLYHLSTLGPISSKNKKLLSAFLEDLEKPQDEAVLKELIYTGVTPTFSTMVEYLKGRLK